MTALQTYIQSLLLEFSPYIQSDEDKSLISQDKVGWITHKLFLKKFRKQKLHDDTIKEITQKVSSRIKEDKPLYFTIPFGGYKHFWNPSHPQPDWAELFSLRFLSDWVLPVLAVHKPGVIFEFISEDMILPRMNNYPEDALETYAKSFFLLLETYQKNIPKNLDIRFFRVGDKYDKNTIVNEVEKLLPSRWQKWKTYTQEQKDIELKRSKRSVFWEGKENLKGLTPEEKEKRMIESRLIELAYYDVEARPEFLGDYFTTDSRIGICFSFGLSPDNTSHWITLGSTYASNVDYWIGRGILQQMEDRFIPRIVSHKQYDEIKSKLTSVSVSLIPLKNFNTIEVYSGELNFNI